MSEGTRRVFLAGSGVGAAAVGLAAVTSVVATGTAGTLPGSVGPAGTPDSGALLASAESAASSLTGSLVAVVHDVAANEVSLMVGEEEIVVHDQELVARLVRAAGR